MLTGVYCLLYVVCDMLVMCMIIVDRVMMCVVCCLRFIVCCVDVVVLVGLVLFVVY